MFSRLGGDESSKMVYSDWGCRLVLCFSVTLHMDFCNLGRAHNRQSPKSGERNIFQARHGQNLDGSDSD